MKKDGLLESVLDANYVPVSKLAYIRQLAVIKAIYDGYSIIPPILIRKFIQFFAFESENLDEIRTTGKHGETRENQKDLRSKGLFAGLVLKPNENATAKHTPLASDAERAVLAANAALGVKQVAGIDDRLSTKWKAEGW